MSSKFKKEHPEETLVNFEEIQEQGKAFYEKHQKSIMYGLGALLVVIGGYLFYKFMIVEPKEKEAIEQIYRAQIQFEKDSFELALKNPGGGYTGFLDIIDKYSGTKTGNMAKYYAGICYLNMGKFEDAKKQLESFKPCGEVTPVMKYGVLGDVYSELNQMDDALSAYKKATSKGDNDFLISYYLKKLGMLSEKLNKPEEAKAAYQRIKDEYPTSPEGNDIEKFLSRLEYSQGAQ